MLTSLRKTASRCRRILVPDKSLVLRAHKPVCFCHQYSIIEEHPMIVRTQADILPIETPGGNQTSALATPSTGSTELSIIRQRQQPGGQNPPHYHDREEVLVLLSGTVTITATNVAAPLAAGEVAIILAQVVHYLTNHGQAPAEWLIISQQGVRFFGADGEEHHPAWAE
jgi:quercetin dioxygenase-like cupin family protein